VARKAFPARRPADRVGFAISDRSGATKTRRVEGGRGRFEVSECGAGQATVVRQKMFWVVHSIRRSTRIWTLTLLAISGSPFRSTTVEGTTPFACSTRRGLAVRRPGGTGTSADATPRQLQDKGPLRLDAEPRSLIPFNEAPRRGRRRRGPEANRERGPPGPDPLFSLRRPRGKAIVHVGSGRQQG